MGPDEYNWYTCGEGRGSGSRWVTWSTRRWPLLATTARSSHSRSSPATPTHVGTTWLRSAQSYFEANSDTVMAVFYFHRAPTNKANMDCVWGLQTPSEFDAYAAMARDTAFRTR